MRVLLLTGSSVVHGAFLWILGAASPYISATDSITVLQRQRPIHAIKSELSSVTVRIYVLHSRLGAYVQSSYQTRNPHFSRCISDVIYFEKKTLPARMNGTQLEAPAAECTVTTRCSPLDPRAIRAAYQLAWREFNMEFNM